MMRPYPTMIANIPTFYLDRISPEPMSGCWLWTGYVNDHDYGRVFLPKGKTVAAHRAMWTFHHGRIRGRLMVCHKCDTPSCVNPAHMFLGTCADNMRDMVAKGRQARNFGISAPKNAARGERSGRAKIGASDVLEIRRRFRPSQGKATPNSGVALGREFGICSGTVLQIVHRKIWQHV